MTPVRALIVDDEVLARETVGLLLEGRTDVEVVGTCANGREAIADIRSERPDLVFLDIQMPERDGFDVIREIGPDRMPVVIFVTAFDQYALKAFEAQALDYLLKPFDDERFEQALDRAIAQVRHTSLDSLSSRLAGLLQNLDSPTPPQPPPSRDRITVKSKTAVEFVAVEDIAWIEAAGDYVVLHVGQKTHLLRDTMQGILERLDPNRFIRIHRSTIVNLDYVKRLQPYFHGDYIVYLHDGTELRLSRRYAGFVNDG